MATEEENEKLTYATAVEPTTPQIVKLNPFKIRTSQRDGDRADSPVGINFKGVMFYTRLPHQYYVIEYYDRPIDRIVSMSEESANFHLAWTRAKEHNKMLCMKVGTGDVPNEYSVAWDGDDIVNPSDVSVTPSAPPPVTHSCLWWFLTGCS